MNPLATTGRDAHDGARVSRLTLAPGAVRGARAEDSAHLVILLDGELTLTVFGDAPRLRAGDVALLGPRLAHGLAAGPAGVTGLELRYPARWFHRHVLSAEEPPPCVVLPGADVLPAIALLRNELADGHVREREGVEGLGLVLLSAAARRAAPGRPEPAVVRRARERMRARFGESTTQARLAGELGVNPSYLARAFRRHAGTTVLEYLRRVRSLEAFRAIRAGARPLAAVATRCGFADQSHMTRVMRTTLGTTPGRVARE